MAAPLAASLACSRQLTAPLAHWRVRNRALRRRFRDRSTKRVHDLNLTPRMPPGERINSLTPTARLGVASRPTPGLAAERRLSREGPIFKKSLKNLGCGEFFRKPFQIFCHLSFQATAIKRLGLRTYTGGPLFEGG
jgi:hypothetical protein